MKKIYLLLFICFYSVAANAQTAASYTFSRFTETFASISGTGTLFTGINCDDCGSGSIPLGFTFTFCGANYTQVAVCSNGWLSLANYVSSNYPASSGNIGGAGWLFPFWRDQHGGYGGSQNFYQTTGSSGSRVFTFEWKSWDSYGYSAQDMNVQIKLYEGTNIVQFCYGPYSATLSDMGIGIANSTSDYQILPNSGSTTCNTSGFSSGTTSLPANGSVLQWALCNSILTGADVPFCAGTSTSITSSIPGGTWSSANTAIATIGSSTGVVTGVSGGTVTISYAAPCGITKTKVVTINPFPALASGNTPVCVGSNITFTNSSGAGSWSSGSSSIATIGGGSGVLTGISNGNADITFTLTSTGCQSVSQATVNALPPANTGTPEVCPGMTTTLSNTVIGGTWSSGTTSVATVGSGTGVVTGVTAGNAVITFTAPVTGCIATTLTTVHPVTAAITGPSTACPMQSTTLSSATPGGTWTSTSPTIAAITPGTGVLTGVSAGLANITYTASTGCVATAVITVNPSPAAITGTANACAGSTSTLSNATAGGTWASGSPAIASVGLGTGVVTGVVAGVTNITYTLASSGCRISVPFLVNPLPGVIGGSPNVCVGATTTLTNSAGGGTWSSGTTGVATVGGGTGVVSGVTPGTSVITYTLPTGCSRNTTAAVSALPLAYTVTGGGNYCSGDAGVHVGMIYSTSGIDYQLYNGGFPTGPVVPGSNSGLDFGLQTTPGTYSAMAINPLTGCTNTMTGTVLVAVNMPPVVYNVSGGGNYCVGGTGAGVYLDNSDPGIQYQLYVGGVATGSPATGTGASINFGLHTALGSYSVIATDPVSGCTSNMNGTVSVGHNPLPTAYTVGGGGHFCAGASGVHITLAGSDAGTNYVIYNGTTALDSIFSTGGGLDFGSFTTAGTYIIVGKDGAACSANMSGSATVIVDPLPVIYAVTGGGGYCTGSAGAHVGLVFSSTGINYQLWYSGSNIVTVPGSGSGLDFGLFTGGGLYTVVAINTTTGCTSNMSGTATISVNPLPNIYSVTGGGNYCLGTTGVHIMTDVSDFGISYQLFRGGTAVGTPVSGTGGPVDFGLFTVSGTYTAVATNPMTGCSVNLAGNAVVGINPLPGVYTVTGGGTYCFGGAGSSVGLNNSASGINYELLIGGYPTGLMMPGTGIALDFGLQSTAAVYTVVASDPVTGCFKNMNGSATVLISPLPNTFNVTGGGNYCSGGTGVHIGLDGSNTGITYQLHNGSGSSGAAMSGSGGALDLGLRTVPGVYYVIARNPLTNCTNMMNGTANIIADPLPAGYVVAGGGAYCVGGAGVDVSIAMSDIGVNYQLYRGSTAIGTTMPGVAGSISFGSQTIAGVYTVRATDLFTGCSKMMPGSAVVTVVSNAVYMVTGGGGYCAGGAGVNVGLGGSAFGVDYQLMAGATPVGPLVSGTGLPLGFGLQTIADVYTVVATNTAYGCVSNMGGSVTVAVNTLPVVMNVTGGGAFCAGTAGANVGLDNSDGGVSYQLYNGVSIAGSSFTGTGAALDFGPQSATGTYTAIATNISTGCSSNMAGSAAVTVKPLPAVYRDSITGPNPVYPGYYCAADSGLHIYLQGSDAGVRYQLWRGTTGVGSPVAGTGGIIDMGLQVIAGAYTITALDTASACTNTMLGPVSVHIIPLPVVHNVIGGGEFCRGGDGLHVLLDGSDPGYTYELFNGPYSAGMLFGTGGALDFGAQTAVGAYTILGNNVITNCPNNMFGDAAISHIAALTPVVTIRAYPGTGVGVWHIDSMRVFVANAGDEPTYQWVVNGNPIAGATNESFTSYEFFNNDSVACMVTASGPCGAGNTTTKSLIITLFNVGVTNTGSVGSEIALIPNPNKGVFTLKGNTGTNRDEELTIEVVNMIGQVVYSGKTIARNGQVEERVQLNNTMANGMYILNLRSGAANAVFHFVVEQ